MGDPIQFRKIETEIKEPCPWCEGDHGWRACPRIRRMQFFGGMYDEYHDVEAIEFWPDDTFDCDIPDDSLLLTEHADLDE